MATKRKLPFGYRMEFGEIVIHPLEAVMVQKIFQQYASGASYKELVDTLRNQDVPYNPGKIWNKNMVARILENRKYVGEQGWPVIIPMELYNHTCEKRSSKAAPVKSTDAQNLLRRLSRGSTAPDVEQSILHLLNDLMEFPEKICVPPIPPPAEQHQIEILQRALNSEMEQQPINEEAAKTAAMELASTRFAAIGNQEYETARLQRLFASHSMMEELDAVLLRSAVSAIHIRKGNVTIRLKNGQAIERSSTS